MDWTITTIYMACAGLGGFVLLAQLVLLMFGGDVDADVDLDGAGLDVGDGSLQLLSIRGLAGRSQSRRANGSRHQWRP